MSEPEQQPSNAVATALQRGISSGIGLLLWGGIVLYCPTYFHTSGWLTTILYVVAVLLLLISVGVTFNEVAEALHSDSLSQLGIALVFGAMAGLLWYFTRFKPFPQPWQTISQFVAVLSALLGALFWANTLAALPTALIQAPRSKTEDLTERRERQTQRFRSIEALLAAALSFGTAIIGLVALVLHLSSGK
jgi:hypothetical protein